jgi:hypothetical protein
MKPAAATILALSFLFVSLMMEQIPFFDRFDNWFITHHFRCWLLVFQDQIPWPRIMESEAILLGICGTAFIIGSTAFQLRDIKS